MTAPMAFSQQEVMEAPQSMPRHKAPAFEVQTPTDASRCKTPAIFSEEKEKREDLKAYQGAMGWQRQIQDMFQVDATADWLTRFASGPVWTFLSIGIVLLNTLVIGVETQ